MLSRVAESVYWMQRYRERAENTARLLDVNLHLSVDAPAGAGDPWIPMVQTMEGEDLFRAKHKSATKRNVVHFLTFDEENPNSILSCLRLARENARSVRETITSEMWNEINTAYLFAQKAAGSNAGAVSRQLFDRIKRQCQLITGIADTCMSHDEAWYFGRIGNLIERADMVTRILDVKYYLLLQSPNDVGSVLDDIQWMALLKSASSLEMYRKLWHRISPCRIVDFLVLDAEFPRSVLSCLVRAEQSLAFISRNEQKKGRKHPHRGSVRMTGELRALSGSGIIRRGLHEFIGALQDKLSGLDEAVSKRYFSLQAAPEAVRR